MSYFSDLRRDNFSKVMGLKRGVVKDLKDPDKMNRVKVTLVDETLETPYADVMARFAGTSSDNQCGTVFVPSVNEEVVLGFLDGDINNPIILGSVYNSKNKPPLTVNDKNEIMMIKFPAGLKIEISNEKDKQKITVTTKKGHSVVLDDGEKEELNVSHKNESTSFKVDFKNGAIELKAEKKIRMLAGNDSLVLEKDKGLKLISTSGGLDVDVNKANIKTKANIDIDAGAKATVKGKAGAELQSTGQTIVKGMMTKIN